MTPESILDNAQLIAKLDAGNVGGSIAALPEQFSQAWLDTAKFALPRSYQTIDRVVVAGMGGSALPAHFIQSVFADRLRLPLTVVSGYSLPAFVNRRTLAVLCSYSGGTEEVLSVLKEARSRRARLVGLTSGGPLYKRLAASSAPIYRFVPRHNPSGAPRLGLGYLIMGLLGILRAAGVLTFSVSEARAGEELLRDRLNVWGPNIPFVKNQAKQLAVAVAGRAPLLIGPEFLAGCLHTFANQLNESAKTFSTYFVLPELNHHLLEGLTHPRQLRTLLAFILFKSSLANPRVTLRERLTQEIIRRQNLPIFEARLRSETPWLAALEALLLGSTASFSLAVLNKENPSLIPWVDYLKKRLGQ